VGSDGPSRSHLRRLLRRADRKDRKRLRKAFGMQLVPDRPWSSRKKHVFDPRPRSKPHASSARRLREALEAAGRRSGGG
jgi:hypothetical protein